MEGFMMGYLLGSSSPEEECEECERLRKHNELMKDTLNMLLDEIELPAWASDKVNDAIKG